MPSRVARFLAGQVGVQDSLDFRPVLIRRRRGLLRRDAPERLRPLEVLALEIQPHLVHLGVDLERPGLKLELDPRHPTALDHYFAALGCVAIKFDLDDL
jgi:hypothetical protein